MSYDSDTTRAYFDAFGEREWDRLEKTLQGRIKYAVHRRLIDAHIRPWMRVLDVGAGPGRFAIDIARTGATVTVVDISDVQLDLARQRLAEQNLLANVAGFHRLDVLDLLTLGEASYDAIVCFGGVISYTRHRHLDALRQLARVARPGAPIMMSVMSLWGTLRLVGPLDAAAFLETPEAHLDWNAVLAGKTVVYTNPTSNEFHQPLVLFTADGLRGALADAGLDVETIGTSDPLLPEFQQVPKIVGSERATEALTALELALCEHSGLADAGAHLLAVARPRG